MTARTRWWLVTYSMTECYRSLSSRKSPWSVSSQIKERKYCGSIQHYEYQLYLAIENIDHSRTKARHPQTNGICERFHRTIQDEFYAIVFRKKIYTSLEQLQTDLDEWVEQYNRERTHTGKYCCFGRTPLQTFRETKPLVQAKQLDTLFERQEAQLNPSNSSMTAVVG